MLPAGPGEVLRRGRLGPGEILVVDPAAWPDPGRRSRQARGDRVDGRARCGTVASRSAGRVGGDCRPAPGPPSGRSPDADPDATRRRRIALGLDAEQLRLTVAAMATSGREPLWSMGDDTPPAFLARRARGVAGFLRQAFAQVTNPPIDPERERLVMSLAIPLGPRPALLDVADAPRRPNLLLDPPVIGASRPGLDRRARCGRLAGGQPRYQLAGPPGRSRPAPGDRPPRAQRAAGRPPGRRRDHRQRCRASGRADRDPEPAGDRGVERRPDGGRSS